MCTGHAVIASRGGRRERLGQALPAPVSRVTVALLATLAGTSVPGGRAEAQVRSAPPVLGDTPVLLSTVVRVALERNRDVLDAEYQVTVAGEQGAEAWSNV